MISYDAWNGLKEGDIIIPLKSLKERIKKRRGLESIFFHSWRRGMEQSLGLPVLIVEVSYNKKKNSDRDRTVGAIKLANGFWYSIDMVRLPQSRWDENKKVIKE